jgi:Protein of unknown function (DUF3485)
LEGRVGAALGKAQFLTIHSVEKRCGKEDEIQARRSNGRLLHEAYLHVPLRESLASFSIQLDGWKGKPTVRLDDRIVAKLGVDEYINRVYYNLDRRWIHLYVGYYQSQRQGSTIHSPKNCLPGAGWQPVESGRMVIPIEGREPVEVNRYVGALLVSKPTVV